MSETVRFFATQISLLAVVLILHTYIGLHVVRRTLIFSDLVLDQLAAFGALVGIGLAIRYGSPGSYLLSLAAVLVGALALAVIKPRSGAVPREAVIGILYAMALVGSLLLGDKLSGGAAYVTKTLTGSLLWVTWPIVGITAAVYVVLLIFHYVYRDRFIALAENGGSARHQKRWDFLFFTTQGIITVLIVPVAGVLLAYAFLMIPAAIAAMFTRRWGAAVLLGWSVGMAACASGVCLSYFRDLPYGPTLILCLGLAFLIAVGVRAAVPATARS
jgi:zinc/manganese transport system permease protein